MHPRRFAILILISLLPALGHAQETDPGDCTLEPVALPLFEATPAAVIAASPIAASTTPVDLDEIAPAVDILFACLNTGDPAYAWAVFTDRYLATWLIETDAYQPAFEQAIDDSTASRDAYTIISVDNVTLLDDDRVSVTVTYSAGTSTNTDTLILAQVDDHWLIDDVSALDPVP